MNLTIVVPTLDRPEFIERMMSFYRRVDSDIHILIGDSSAEGSDWPQYVDCRGLNDRQALIKLSTLVTTPYVAYMGDDDFLLPSGLRACVDYLEAHPDHVAAGGESYAFNVRRDEARGEMKWVGGYALPCLLQDTAQDRLMAHFRDYRVTLFCVQRTAAWRRAWEEAASIEDRSFGAELLPAAIPVALGKVATLPRPYLLRQSGNAKRVKLPSMADWIRSPGWQAGMANFRDIVAGVVAEVDGTEYELARQFVMREFSRGYLKLHVDAPDNAEIALIREIVEASPDH
jgi:glycosyltransferase domain-containing protein